MTGRFSSLAYPKRKKQSNVINDGQEEDRVMGEEQSARDIRINDTTREGEEERGS